MCSEGISSGVKGLTMGTEAEGSASIPGAQKQQSKLETCGEKGFGHTWALPTLATGMSATGTNARSVFSANKHK